jgi:hypothetical protein
LCEREGIFFRDPSNHFLWHAWFSCCCFVTCSCFCSWE